MFLTNSKVSTASIAVARERITVGAATHVMLLLGSAENASRLNVYYKHQQ